jgi:rhodanese-related sulfurtransferase
MLLLIFGSTVNASEKQVSSITTDKKSMSLNLECNVTNITVQEAWDLLTNTSNGIQIPIDVRYDYEWLSGYIDTPYPECPRWYVLNLLDNETGLQEFIDLFDGEEVILYCKGGYRSLVGSYILCESNFTGRIYNMLGGITAWQSADFPIRNNTQPNAPNIDGPLNGKPGIIYFYNFTTEDAEDDGIYYWVDWGDNSTIEWFGPYGPDELVLLPHTWTKQGFYIIQAKAKDFYGNESDLTKLVVNMPRNKGLNKPFLNWLHSHPNMFPLIQLLIQRLGLQ